MFKRIILEMSLKPFKQTDDAYITQVVRKVFTQWRPLIKNRQEISVMLWTADGSEILDYNGKADDEFQWACFVGTANNPLIGPEDSPTASLHKRKHYYMDNPPAMTYGILQKIVRTIKEVGQELYPASVISVGETFDIGPEFAVSDFKYKRHPEISTGQTLDTFGFLDATALLKADDRPYAAYPNGIPAGTPFATFFGKQSNLFLRDMGFDFIWLSNGVGFGDCPWDPEGKIYDGKAFHPEKLALVKEHVLSFWRLFRAECPDFLIATRGTNFSVGIDYATDGVAQYDIYKGGFHILPPPNSPWAALNDNFGQELAGHMTRICELPDDEFLFRYYIHDPWWVNSPWYDRYGEQPHDIYLPMAISRIDENGKTRSAGIFGILSIDNSFGDMPDACVNEPIPHILKAEKDSADSPAPIVWVYPMREYSAATTAEELAEMYSGDNYVMDIINDGFPLNCVVSTDNFLKHDVSLYQNSILLSPVGQSKEVQGKLAAFEKQGGKVIYYGSQKQLNKRKAAYKLNCNEPVLKARELLGALGYSIEIEKISDAFPSPVISFVSKDNGYILSAYNPNLTNTVKLSFPHGAPLLTGTECEIKDGHSIYHFPKSLHKECRVFVRQKSGVVSLRELAPVSTVFHRTVMISGLEDATVVIYPEARSIENFKVSGITPYDAAPIFDERFRLVQDDNGQRYWQGEHISGEYHLLFPFEKE